MYIRRKQNKSGSTSIYIVEKQNGKQILIKSMGAAIKEYEILRLEQLAQEEISKLTKQTELQFDYQSDQQHIKHLANSISSVRVVGTELVLVKIFNEIGFNQIPDKLFRDLVITRLVYPGSKLRTIEYLSRHYQEHYSTSTVYRYLDKLNTDDKEKVQQISFNHTLNLFDGVLATVFYDVSTLYFETSKEDELRKIGFSKDGKTQNPQIVLGLLVSTGGYPLAFEMFEGNKYEGETLITVLDAFKKTYSLEKLIVVADAGLLSNKNITLLKQKKYEFVLGARIKNSTNELQQKIISKKWKEQSINELEQNQERLIISYSEKRAKKDTYNREKGIQRLKKRIKSGKLTKENINNRGYNKYLKIEGKATVKLDLSKEESDKKWDGLKGYLTNSLLPAKEIIEKYRELWQIEKAFRISKTDLKVRPIYHYKADRIKAHLIISFSSYKLYKELERQLKEKQTGLSPEKALDILKSIYGIATILPTSGLLKHIILAKTEEQKNILNAFEIEFYSR